MKSSVPEESDLTLSPFFLARPAGRVFCVFVGPPPDASRRGGVLFVAPFAEEMNKARRQVMLQARSFAAAGYGVLLMDLYGTGDSEGDFADGRMDVWRGDLMAGADWLEGQGFSTLAVWGVRWGALLAVELLRTLGARATRLVLWQPVVDGAQYMDQFIRLRVASSMLGSGAKVTVQDLRRTLGVDGSLEVAGYRLDPELVAAIDACKLTASPPPAGAVVDWIEVVADGDGRMGAGSERTIASWERAGLDVRPAVVVGQKFWSTVETTIAPALVDHTTRTLSVSQ